MDNVAGEKLKDLKLKANQARQLLIETLAPAGSGHTGGPLGMADIFTAFYFHILRHDPKNPDWADRDRLILSNGHICPIRYVLMAMSGYFPIEELKTLRKLNSRLQGHPHRTTLPGLETTSGPLGEGISQAIGMALARDLDKKDHFIYVLTSDGEHQEGNTWEAAMFAGKLKLRNFIQVIDRNKIQIDGNTEDIMPLEPLKEKYEAFNWNVLEVDGNDIQAFIETIKKARELTNKPTFILANTVPGKNVSFMENNYRWHGVTPDGGEVKGAPPKGEQAKKALEELKAWEEKIKNE
jgi:transketolase